MFRIAMLSRWHVHGLDNRYVKELVSIRNTQITCVWDEVLERGANWAYELGCDFEPDLKKILSRDDVDGVIITAPTCMHKDLTIAAAKAGKHIFIEKSLALNVVDALEVKRVIDETGVQFCIAFPRRSNREFAYGRDLYQQGTLGEISMVRIRNGFNIEKIGILPDYWFKKEQTGGGAMIDLGCHPIYLAFWLLGEPVCVSSTFTHLFNREVEDAAVSAITFKNKAIAIVESTYNAPLTSVYTFEIYGTKGIYLATDGCEKVTLKRVGCAVEEIEVASILEYDPSPLQQWVAACNGMGRVRCDINEAVTLVRILEAAYKADDESRTIFI